MEEKKKGLIWLIVILIVLVCGLIGYIIFDKVMLTDKENTKSTTTTENSESNNNEDSNYQKKDIVLDFEKEKEKNYMEIGNGLPSQYTEDKYTINMTIDNIKVNGTKHNVKIKNFEPNDYNCEKGKDKVVYFDDKSIYEPMYEGCYLTSLGEIIVFKNNYIILRFFSEGGGWFNIYDSQGNELKSKEDISVAELKSVDEDVIKFISYEYDENSEESMCRPNEYEMTIENNVIKYTLVKTGEYTGCM